MKNINQNKYNRNRALLLLKGFIPSFIGIFIPKIKNRLIFSSVRNEPYNYNSKYLFEYFMENHPDKEIKFVINNKEKRNKLNKQFGIKNNYFIETETIQGIWYVLRAKSWIISGLETPVGGFLLKFNRFVYHVGHGAYFRSAGFIENGLPLKKRIWYHLIKNNFTYHLITSEAIAKITPKMFGCTKKQIKILGEPMNDIVNNPNINQILKHFDKNILEDKNILYMPTWRPDGSVNFFPFDDLDWRIFVDFLEKEKINIFLRSHPAYEEDLSIYTNKTQRIKILDSNKAEDINEVVGFFDLLISDYSSGFVGFLLTLKPVLFLPYDYDKYVDKLGFVLPYDKATPGPKPTTQKAFLEEIKKLLNDKSYYLKERKKASLLFNKYTKDNCKMNAEFILEEIK